MPGGGANLRVGGLGFRGCPVWVRVLGFRGCLFWVKGLGFNGCLCVFV